MHHGLKAITKYALGMSRLSAEAGGGVSCHVCLRRCRDLDRGRMREKLVNSSLSRFECGYFQMSRYCQGGCEERTYNSGCEYQDNANL